MTDALYTFSTTRHPMHPSVSVVIPVFNGARHIAAAIKSVLSQTLLPEEIIVVNDGSTDATHDILTRFRDSITTINTNNGGVSRARNIGIGVARAEWIAFLDADDVWDDTKLERQFDLLRQFPSCGFCFCDYRYQSAADQVLRRHFDRFEGRGLFSPDTPLRPDAYAALLVENLVGTASSVLVKREVLEKTGLFQPAYRQAEDYALWLRCALFTEMLPVSAALLLKVRHDSNLTNDFLDTLLWHERVLLDVGTDSAPHLLYGNRRCLKHRSLARIRYQIANLSYESGRPLEALRYYALGAKSENTIANQWLCVYHVARKLVRIATFGLVRNHARRF
jgi:glycosyltransferase involved in cell wall biosynthesis